ncbi:hypothetical protein [Gilliamella sp. ESL0250]|nr:hypothetical protein [Gilliamella sp. ESL0250]NUF49083.1 transposase [Gilliamella sp. ESL0250]
MVKKQHKIEHSIYNTERPHKALNNMTSIEYKTLKQATSFSTSVVCSL